ncbi:MAG: phosphatase PAP2 family protein [Phyllobacteriaceae bacterium]|nr:phosphatase PAP2 family protein [Phyllobacteriaceae bacterium]
MFDRNRLLETIDLRARATSARFVDGCRRLGKRRPRALREGPAGERASFVLASGLVVALAAIKLFDPLMRGRPEAVDGSLAHAVLGGLTWFGEGVEILVGSGVLVIFLAAIDPAGLGRASRARLAEVSAAFAFVFASVAGSGLVAALAKNLLGRARPEHLAGDAIFEIHAAVFKSNWAAFPSGHATTAGASAVVLALLFPRFARAFLVAGAVIALTRIGLGAHFPSDVAAGFALGAAFTLMLARALSKRGLVFRTDGEGRLALRPIAGPAGWFDLLANLIAARRPPQG